LSFFAAKGLLRQASRMAWQRAPPHILMLKDTRSSQAAASTPTSVKNVFEDAYNYMKSGQTNPWI
jgi:hypothetical protein